MVIQLPRYHDVPAYLSKKCFDDTESLLPGWEISVQRADDIAWSIVLSYLSGTNYREKNIFSERLKALTGSDENATLVKNSIRHFNPFRNRFSCFFDEALKCVVNDFKLNLNWDSLQSIHQKLSVASECLHCQILVVFDNPGKGIHHAYLKSVKDVKNIITLKLSTNIINDENEKIPSRVCSFMISRRLGFIMKRAALSYFLREANMTKKEIKRIMSEVGKESSFLISMLKGNLSKSILRIYRSAYIVSKISEAGYETDPRSRDSEGFSALHHALFLEEFETLYKLYFFAASSCSQSAGPLRNPDPLVVANLHDMEKILSEDLSKLKDLKHHQKYNEWTRTFEELLKLNKFLTDVNCGILKIKKRLNYYESSDEKIFEAHKWRDVIITLLDTYEIYFHPMLENSGSPLNLFILHRNYYNMIDMSTAIIFFENIVFLKERLALKGKILFSEIESSFYFLIIHHIVLGAVDFLKLHKNSDPVFEFDLKSLYIIPLTKRNDNLVKIKKFNNTLRSIVISKENVVSNIPKREIHSILQSCPEFKDEIEISRLKHHIEAALSVKVNSVKSILVIENALQVIGEYIVPENVNDFSFRRFLSLCLPNEISQILSDLRHRLTHLKDKDHAFPSKLDCEKNFPLFRSIQKDILAITQHFKVVYQVQELNGYIYIVKLLQKEMGTLKKKFHTVKGSVHSYTNTCERPFYLDENFVLFVDILPGFIFEKYRHFYVSFFRTVLERLENINDIFEKEFDEFNVICANVKHALWPLKWLLKLLQKCQSGNNNPGILLDLFKAIEVSNEKNSTLNDFKKQTNSFILKCNNFLFTFDTIGIKKRKGLKPIESIRNIEKFLKILNGHVFLSDNQKNKIREKIPAAVRQSVLAKDRLISNILIHWIHGFSFEIYEESSNFDISYLTKEEMNTLKQLIRSKNPEPLSILNTPDPIKELEEIFRNNCTTKEKCDSLCRRMKFPPKTKKILLKLVPDQRKKTSVNYLSILLNRIQLLRKFIIDENKEISNLISKVKSQKARQLILDKMVHMYLKDRKQQLAVDMLLFDCMVLFEGVECAECLWLKSSKLYSGINLRNVMSHGSPLLESLCKMLDQEDLPAEKIEKILRLIEGEDGIKAILELFKFIHSDYEMLLKIVKSEVEDEYSDWRERILKCDEWENYALLLRNNCTKDKTKRFKF